MVLRIGHGAPRAHIRSGSPSQRRRVPGAVTVTVRVSTRTRLGIRWPGPAAPRALAAVRLLPGVGRERTRPGGGGPGPPLHGAGAVGLEPHEPTVAAAGRCNGWRKAARCTRCTGRTRRRRSGLGGSAASCGAPGRCPGPAGGVKGFRRALPSLRGEGAGSNAGSFASGKSVSPALGPTLILCRQCPLGSDSLTGPRAPPAGRILARLIAGFAADALAAARLFKVAG